MQERYSGEKIEICADKGKVFEVFMNLITNAIKFTQSGSIEICVSDKEDRVECSITDTGSGIPEEKLDKLFQKFQRLGAKEKGTGLGLAITQGIVTAHGGKIWAESEPGMGTKFIFTLPKDNRS